MEVVEQKKTTKTQLSFLLKTTLTFWKNRAVQEPSNIRGTIYSAGTERTLRTPEM